MPRTIIAVHAAQQGPDYFYLEEGPAGIAGTADLVELKIRPTDAAFTGLTGAPVKNSAVRDAGKLIYETLVSHGAISTTMPVVLSALAANLQNKESPIFLSLNSRNAENLPWEALWETTKEFLALDPDRRWPIGRLAFSAARSSTLDRIREPVLKVTAILAAATENAGPEWDSLYAALSSLGNKVRIQVFVSQDELLNRIRSQIGGAGQPNVSVAFTGDLKSLLTNMYAFGPNIVHFFCHGSVGDRATLEIETRIDRATDSATGSLVVEVTQLAVLPQLETVWLTTLNCCKGAQASKVNSFAKNLVESGMPAVVAMREAVAVADAYVFTRAFYESLLVELNSEVFQQGNAATQIPVSETVWARALHGPRQELLDRKVAGRARAVAAASSTEWTLPVLYANRAELRLQPRGEARPLGDAAVVKLRTELSVLRSTRSMQTYNHGPKAYLDFLDNEIAQREAQLYVL